MFNVVMKSLQAFDNFGVIMNFFKDTVFYLVILYYSEHRDLLYSFNQDFLLEVTFVFKFLDKTVAVFFHLSE